MFIACLLRAAGYDVIEDISIRTKIWTKAVLNASINPLCAISGLRLGEMARTPELDALQDRVLEECLSVLAGKGILGSAEDATDQGGDAVATLRANVKAHSFSKFSRPSMLQAVQSGKRTEIDALNARFVAEGEALGLVMTYNIAVVAFVKGVERCAITRREEPASAQQDWYDAWERREAVAGRAGNSPMLSKPMMEPPTADNSCIGSCSDNDGRSSTCVGRCKL